MEWERVAAIRADLINPHLPKGKTITPDQLTPYGDGKSKDSNKIALTRENFSILRAIAK